jgi:ADP-ribose pyrophosphatase YjhB (NUDIX family)
MIKDWAAGREGSFRRGRPGAGAAGYIPWLRQRVGHAPIVMVGASAFVQDGAGRVLLVRRTDDGTWSLPAGAMDLGERLDQTVVREVREETGLEVEPERVIGMYTGPEMFHTYPNGDQAHIVSTLFACRIVGGELRADGVETSDVALVAPDSLPPLGPRARARVADGLAGRVAVWR